MYFFISRKTYSFIWLVSSAVLFGLCHWFVSILKPLFLFCLTMILLSLGAHHFSPGENLFIILRCLLSFCNSQNNSLQSPHCPLQKDQIPNNYSLYCTSSENMSPFPLPGLHKSHILPHKPSFSFLVGYTCEQDRLLVSLHLIQILPEFLQRKWTEVNTFKSINPECFPLNSAWLQETILQRIMEGDFF